MRSICHDRSVSPTSPTPTWHPDASHLEGLTSAAVAVGTDLKITYFNPAARELYDFAYGQMIGVDVLEALVPARLHGGTLEVLRQVLAGAPWQGDLPMLCADQREAACAVSVSPVWDRARIAGALMVAHTPPGPEADRARSALLTERLARLARVATDLMTADDVEAVSKIVISQVADAAGATVSSMSLLLDDKTLALAGIRGGPDDVESRWATYSVDEVTPVGDAVRTGRPVVLANKDEIHRRYPQLEVAAEGERSMLCLPLRVSARPIGAIALSFPGERKFDGLELEFFGILADTCAQALDRLKAVSLADEQSDRLAFLAKASAEMASSLDYQVTLKAVARLGVPKFAEWCSISLAEDGDLRTLVVAHVEPGKVQMAEDLQRRYPPDPESAQGAYAVMRTGVSQLIPEITDEMLVAVAKDEEHLRLARELNLRSALVVPLRARGRVLGVISWVSGVDGRRFSERDQSFAEDLAQRAAVAIDNAHLHSETREAAMRLQQAVLPEALPAVPGWEMAALYQPAGRTDVGGDFYDVVPLEGGELACFVGDVMGRGVGAAAPMAQMRAALRAYIAVDPSPEVVLGMLDLMFAHYEIAKLVTLLYVVSRPDLESIEVINAGHPPPVILRADGTAEHLPYATARPLGAGADSRVALRVPFSDGDTLVAFTDGLIERRNEDIDDGLQRLVDATPVLASSNLDTFLGRLVESVRDHTRDDDVAALAIRRAAS